MDIIEHNGCLWFAYVNEGELTVTTSVLVDDSEIPHLLGMTKGMDLLSDSEARSSLYLHGKKRTRIWQITDQSHNTTHTTNAPIATS